MAIFKTDNDIAILREAGRRLAVVLDAVIDAAMPGVRTADLNTLAEQRIRDGGDKPAFLGYTPVGAKRPFPATLCVSVNDAIVHGIPNESPYVLKSGDIVGLDLGLVHKGVFVDMARTIGVGEIDENAKRLLAATESALNAGVAAVRAGARMGDISSAIEQSALPTGFGIVRELGGHGVGRAVHEEPYVPNIGDKGTGPKLIEGMALCIEPMLNEGGRHIVLAPDGYTYKTKDHSRSAHFEHTILVTKGGAEIVTRV